MVIRTQCLEWHSSQAVGRERYSAGLKVWLCWWVLKSGAHWMTGWVELTECEAIKHWSVCLSQTHCPLLFMGGQVASWLCPLLCTDDWRPFRFFFLFNLNSIITGPVLLGVVEWFGRSATVTARQNSCNVNDVNGVIIYLFIAVTHRSFIRQQWDITDITLDEFFMFIYYRLPMKAVVWC